MRLYALRMQTLQQQIAALQVIVHQQHVSAKRQRLLNIALLSVLVAGGFIAAVRPVGDATFDTITCKGWKVVDTDAKTRIVACTKADGSATVGWLDQDGKLRINAGTFADGEAALTFADKNEKKRISAFIDGEGSGTMSWADKRGVVRIGAGIDANGNVLLPTYDFIPLAKP